MSIHVVTLSEDIVFNPPDVVSEILQNVRTIISTRIGTVPLDRDFGLSWDAVDEPLPIAQVRMRLAVIEAVKKYEPRAKVVSVELQDDIDKALEGIAVASVTVMIEEENE
ncbi:GPW/gp25 family protein [Turicimonas muris]|uniref:GPW/gp25 family protein n=1 Tax=Turicimonas muris TaxID=1796652 RepID=UPI00249524FC|nr:GPW/gp25 family protein [Turicimonas muris]